MKSSIRFYSFRSGWYPVIINSFSSGLTFSLSFLLVNDATLSSLMLGCLSRKEEPNIVQSKAESGDTVEDCEVDYSAALGKSVQDGMLKMAFDWYVLSVSISIFSRLSALSMHLDFPLSVASLSAN
ncbi:hypothetical protein RCL_jg22015.t1 [Rhizophagus clarus]|uniref:Uncharacterized protein n=1 Tax=Rhizophagus clarus TaxID=94130 RepID=A0A8H3LVL4_9GLOM|nr:hypothetical protein RCL_jg22015.t1 [Rhizophagus clarus]